MLIQRESDTMQVCRIQFSVAVLQGLDGSGLGGTFSTRGNKGIYLNVSGTNILTIKYNNCTLLSSLNVSGFTSLNNNVSLISSLNVSGYTSLNNNVWNNSEQTQKCFTTYIPTICMTSTYD